MPGGHRRAPKQKMLGLALASLATASAQIAPLVTMPPIQLPGVATLPPTQPLNALTAATTQLPSDVVTSMVDGTDCLKWYGDGCSAIDSEEICLSSRDGSSQRVLDGKKVFAMPCFWCGGQDCTANTTQRCAPLSLVQGLLPVGSVVANCSALETEVANSTWTTFLQRQLPSTSDGNVQRNLSFQNIQSIDQSSGGQACRGSTVSDSSNLNVSGNNYYSTWSANSLQECYNICSWKQDCTGVEFSEESQYCEVWKAAINWTQAVDGYGCFLARDSTEPPLNPPNDVVMLASAGISTPFGNLDLATSDGATGGGGMNLFMLLALAAGGVIVLGIVFYGVFKCYKGRKGKKHVKRSAEVKREQKQVEMVKDSASVESGDEMQPLMQQGMQNGTQPLQQNGWFPQTAMQGWMPQFMQGGGYRYEPLSTSLPQDQVQLLNQQQEQLVQVRQQEAVLAQQQQMLQAQEQHLVQAHEQQLYLAQQEHQEALAKQQQFAAMQQQQQQQMASMEQQQQLSTMQLQQQQMASMQQQQQQQTVQQQMAQQMQTWQQQQQEPTEAVLARQQQQMQQQMAYQQQMQAQMQTSLQAMYPTQG